VSVGEVRRGVELLSVLSRVALRCVLEGVLEVVVVGSVVFVAFVVVVAGVLVIVLEVASVKAVLFGICEAIVVFCVVLGSIGGLLLSPCTPSLLVLLAVAVPADLSAALISEYS